jgi:hypothetical protein
MKSTLILLALLACVPAHAINKCVVDGQTSYQAAPCPVAARATVVRVDAHAAPAPRATWQAQRAAYNDRQAARARAEADEARARAEAKEKAQEAAYKQQTLAEQKRLADAAERIADHTTNGLPHDVEKYCPRRICVYEKKK